MKSNDTKSKNNHDVSGASDGVSYRKVKFPLYVFEDTMKTVNALYKYDNCRSKTEFIEKAIRFYSGYVMNNKDETMEFIAPQIASIMEGTIKGSEQRLARAIFKLAVEVGVQTHMLAAINEMDESYLFKMRSNVTDEVRRINGIINFERATRYQRGEE